MDLKDSDRAANIAHELERLQQEKDSRSYHIGRLGYYAKQMGKDFLFANNMDSWNAFWADVNMSRSTVDNYIGLYRKFGEDGLKLTEEEWTDIGPRKLRIIAPITWGHNQEKCTGEFAGNYPLEELLEMARTLSASDLIKEIKGDSAKSQPFVTADSESLPVAPDTIGSDLASRLSPAHYKEKVKESPCCICGQEETDRMAIHSHHWPQTRVRTDRDWKVIPVCAECHDLLHRGVNLTAQIMNGWFWDRWVEEER